MEPMTGLFSPGPRHMNGEIFRSVDMNFGLPSVILSSSNELLDCSRGRLEALIARQLPQASQVAQAQRQGGHGQWQVELHQCSEVADHLWHAVNGHAFKKKEMQGPHSLKDRFEASQPQPEQYQNLQHGGGGTHVQEAMMTSLDLAYPYETSKSSSVMPLMTPLTQRPLSQSAQKSFKLHACNATSGA